MLALSLWECQSAKETDRLSGLFRLTMNAALNRRPLSALPPHARLGWGLALAGSLLLVGLAAAPSWLPAEGAAAVHRAYAWLCHQLPDRSPHVHGVPLALCHRCFGIAGGLLAGVALAPVLFGVAPRLEEMARRRIGPLLAVAFLPLAVDWVLGALGVWANTPLSRTLTGAVFGLAAGVVLALGVGIGEERRNETDAVS